MTSKEDALREDARIEDRTYVLVWLALMGLLALTFFVARMEIPRFGSMANILISSVKAVIVLGYFMHLRKEGWLLKSTLALTILILTFVIMLTFSDVWFR